MIIRDGEGATRVARIRIEGAASLADADRVARTVAESPLVKTALHGGDPNWGRLLAAAGRSGVAIDPGAVSIWIGDVQVAKGGERLHLQRRGRTPGDAARNCGDQARAGAR